MRPPSLLVLALVAVCASPAFVGVTSGVMTTEDAVRRAAVLLVTGWLLELLLRPAALRLIHGPAGTIGAATPGPDVPSGDGPSAPEVA